MTQPAGAHSRTIEGFALAQELRAHRLAAHRGPKDLASRLHLSRAKIDALELGYYDSGDPRKRAGRLSREEFLRLAGPDGLGLTAPEASALLHLAHAAGAIAGGEPFQAGAGVTESEARRGASERTASHAAAFARTHAAPPSSTESREVDAEWAPPSPRCRTFYGRSAEVSALAEALVDDRPPSVILISGFPGAGKSELVQVALRRPEVRAAFHGLRWLSARQREFLGGTSGGGTGARVQADDVLRQLAGSLRCRTDELPRVLQATRWLIAIDNSEAVADEELLIGQLARVVGRSRIVLTSRNRYAAPFLRVLPADGPLRGLAPEDAQRLLGDTGLVLAAEDRARVQALTGGAPLALHWIAGRAAHAPINELVAEIERGAAADLYGFMFDNGWRELTAASRDVLDYLAHQVVEPVPLNVLASAAVGRGELGGAVNELRQLSFIEESLEQDASLLSLHPLMTAFVEGRLRGTSSWSGDREPAWRAGLTYLRAALHHDRKGSAAIQPIGGIRNYLDWMDDALRAGCADEVLITWLKLSRYLWEHWQWQPFERCEEIAAAASSALASTHAAAAEMLAGLSRTDAAYQAMERADFATALASLDEASARFETLDDDAGRSLAHRYRGLVFLRRAETDDLRRSREEFTSALAVIDRGRTRGFPATGTGAAVACEELRTLAVWDTLIAGYAAYRGDWAPGEAEVHALIAGLLLNEGRAADAVAAARAAIERYRESPNRWPGSEAAPMLTLARALIAAGDPGASRKILEEALAVADAADRLDLKEGALLQLAQLDANEGSRDLAIGRATAALAIATSLRQTAEISTAQALLERLGAGR